MDNEKIKVALSETTTVGRLMEILSQYDGRFPVCFVDGKNNMVPFSEKDIKMKPINILLPNHTHVFDFTAVVIDKGE